MAKDTFYERVEQAIERLYEDEALRSSLDDASAEVLLSWASRTAKSEAARVPMESGEEVSIRSLMAPIRKAIRDINELVELRPNLSDDEVRLRVGKLLTDYDESLSPKSLPVDEVVTRQRELGERDFVARLVALLDTPRATPRAAKPPPPAKPASGRAASSGSFSSFSGQTMLTSIGGLLAAFLLAVCLLGSGYLLFIRGGEPTAPAPEVAPPATTEAGPYTVYFTRPQYPDDAATRRPSELGDALANLIDSATRTVDVAAYQLDLPIVVDALLAAVERGVQVRVVTDIDILLDEDESEPFILLEDAGVTVVGGNSNAIMHNKFVVVDNAAVWTGSWNLTENDTYRYNNHAILIRSTDLARNYTATFEKMWEEQAFGRQREPGGTRPRLTIGGVAFENYFSPEDGVAEQLVNLIGSAEESVEFMAFSFTSDPIGQALLEAADAGVEVRGVFETTGSNTEFSEYGALRSAGLAVLQDGNPYLMHHKVFIVDQRFVVLGSYNFSQNAETDNDENLLIVDDPRLASQFLAEFERVYSQAQNPPNR
ncbi:MAG TPA: phospholipase D-like domain-containing protein [Ardenticatenaceae bacterium]